MFFIRRPSAQFLKRFQRIAEQDSFSYEELRTTLDGPLPSGYVVDHNRVRLGQGDLVFERARRALMEWKMFDLGWVELMHPSSPVVVPDRQSLSSHTHWNLYSLSASRVIEMIDSDDGQIVAPWASVTAPCSTMLNAEKSGSAVEYHRAG